MSKYFIIVRYNGCESFETRLWECKDYTYRTKCFGVFYHNSKKDGYYMTDKEYYEAMINMINRSILDINKHSIETIIINPSAASFIELCRKYNEFNITMSYPNDYNDTDQIKHYIKEHK